MKNDQSHLSTIKTRGIYLLPNLFTTAALFAGFYSIVAAMKGLFDISSLAIFVAAIADTLDGRVARLTNTQSAFGAEYDSLSDMVAFGVAPALLVYSWSLMYLGKFGWLIAFLYTAATALRLARFNTQAHDQDKNYFQGLPCPAGAGVVVGFVWSAVTLDLDGQFLLFPAASITALIAAFMVSTIRYNSFKKFDLKGKVPFVAVVTIVLIIALIAIDPPQVMFVILFLYAFLGPLLNLWQLRRVRNLKKRRALRKT